MNRRSFLHLAALFLAGCTLPPTTLPTAAPTPTTGPTPIPVEPTACRLAPISAPTRPAVIPNLDQVDENGLHVTGSGPVEIDPLSYRLKVSGLVEQPLELSLDELRCLPRIAARVVLTCQGIFRDETTYAGVPLVRVLELARLKKGAGAVHLLGADHNVVNIDLRDALDEDTFLAYQWKTEPLPILHGFPLRAVIPSLLGYAWTKYLVEIQVVEA